ncbi:MAG: alpha/beta fold hydrolase [Candidatus Dormibacteria bacterium]
MFGRISDRIAEAMDAGVRWQLSTLPVALPPPGSWGPVDPVRFWEESRVHDPVPLTLGRLQPAREDGVEIRTLEGASRGPGSHPGSRRLVATARLCPGRRDRPLVLVIHGLLSPFPWYEAWQCRELNRRGAHAVRIDLPYHLRRRPPGGRSGVGYISPDLRWTRDVVRQSVEDCAAVVAWARQEVSDRVAVFGVSLGGLIACLLAAQVELDSLAALAPFCDPAETLMDHLPARPRRILGLDGDGGGAWGRDHREARLTLDAALAPLVPRNFRPATPPERIAIIRPTLDTVVGDAPMERLAETWGCELWNYRQGHISVMNARGLTPKIHDWLLRPHRSVTGRGARVAAVKEGRPAT